MQGIVHTLMILVICFNLACTKDETYSAEGTLVDIDKNTYHTLVIGSQTWMLEDLLVTHYNDGTNIPTCNVGQYDFYMVETEKLCPINWHVPKSWEWSVLVNYFEETNTPPQIGNIGYWWSSSTLVEGYDSPQAWFWYQNEEYMVPQEFVSLKEQYLPVRCIKD
jgi:hypothetical protein